MKILRHLLSQPFIVATGFAALIHSTWSLGTFFSGEAPSDGLHYILWVIPALLIAFSLDIGQIVTSAEIRDGQHSRAKYLTFATFAAATYFLQFVYCASHMPEIALAPGVRESWGGIVSLIRDSAVFIVPALLPLSTLLYTFSQEHSPQTPVETPATPSSSAIIAVLHNDQEELTIERPQTFEVECPEHGCDWAGAGYKTERAAKNALTGHMRKHENALAFSSNGKH